jgi:hypothetical protein
MSNSERPGRWRRGLAVLPAVVVALLPRFT